MEVYEVVFKVTETCNNGKERRITKSVYAPRFKNGRHTVVADNVSMSVRLLQKMHYYNIEFVAVRNKTLLFSEEVEA